MAAIIATRGCTCIGVSMGAYWGIKYGLDDVKSELKKIDERLERLEKMLENLLNELRKAYIE